MNIVLIRGGGDLASGIALRLRRCGFQTLITELPEPLAVRRAVSFCEAVYEGQWQVEEITAERVETRQQMQASLQAGKIPVLIDPNLAIFSTFRIQPAAIIDARLTKRPPAPLPFYTPLHIGVGPGFIAGENCAAVIESQRGHTLGRVIWRGPGNPDSATPEGDPARVLRASADGVLIGYTQIGDHLESGEIIATVKDRPITAPFSGTLRGIIRPGIRVTKGMKIGDLDKRDKREYCYLVSEKALAIAGGALEAILSFESRKSASNQVDGYQ